VISASVASVDRPMVMGVLNVTPDSFFDGGRYDTTERAVAHGLALVDAGADIVDVGGESSRPGAVGISVEEELARVIPVIAALAGAVRISVDTVKPEVAVAAVEAGATLLNDISASLWEVAAGFGTGAGAGAGAGARAGGPVGWLAMHMQGSPRTMQAAPHYADVVSEVHQFVLERAEVAMAAGVAEVWVDPGIGFGKTLEHNLSLLHHLPELISAASAIGCAGVAVGTSRKRFLGVLAAPGQDEPAGLEERAEGSLATAVVAMTAGATLVRVHDVAATVQAARLYGPGAEQRTGPFGSSSRSGGVAA
jgi:dihydropteroate synthase